MIVQSAAPQPATIAVRKVTSVVNAALPRRTNRAIAAVKLVTSRASVPTPPEEPHLEAWAAAIPPAEEAAAAARSATNAEKLAILLVTAPKVVPEATQVVDTLEAEGTAAATGLDAHNKPATPAADTDTCLVIAPRDRNATTVSLPLSLSSGQADRIIRRRSWPFESRLPIGAYVRTRLLQVQATRTRPGHVPQLTVNSLSWNPLHHRLELASSCTRKNSKKPLQTQTSPPRKSIVRRKRGKKAKQASKHRAPGQPFSFFPLYDTRFLRCCRCSR